MSVAGEAQKERTRYCGRFAPTPSGPLHFGSLVAALASCLEAQTRRGAWLLRIEDADFPRNRPGSEDTILRVLETHGFTWEGEILRQSQRLEAYRAALESLKAAGKLYPCSCSRKKIAASNPQKAIDGSLVYPGFCRDMPPSNPDRQRIVWRVRLEEAAQIHFCDLIQGEITQYLAREVGDFILWRNEGVFAYQLTVIVDDAWQGITHVMRGADLIDSTARQIYLQRALGFPAPIYAHLPIAANPAGEKLSKQTRAAPLKGDHAAANLVAALEFLGQQPSPDLARAHVTELWTWARENWNSEKIPRVRMIRTTAGIAASAV